MFRQSVCLAVAAVFSSAALAQSGFSRVTWEASLDSGQTWQRGLVQVDNPAARVQVRALVDWEYPGSYALASVQFDATVTTHGSSGLADLADDLERVSPFHLGFSQTLAAMRFGNVLKIDDVTDPHPPGLGQGRVRMNQLIEVAGFPFTRDNPALVFRYTLVLDGTTGLRTASHVWFPHPTQGTPVRPTVFLTPEGATASPGTILIQPLELNVIPAPATLGLLLPLLAFHRRR